MKTILLVPRWGGDATSDWYPWLERELRGEAQVATAPLRPSPDAPTIEACDDSIAETLEKLPGAPDMIVAHSVGNQAALRYVAGRDIHVPAMVCVAGWLWVDEPWDTLLPWQETPLETETLRHRIARLDVLLGEGDPFTSDLEQNAVAWRIRLGAQVTRVAGAKHFNREAEPDVLAAVRRSL